VEVHTRSGGDGVLCWNVEPMRAYAHEIEGRQIQLTGANPDLVVTPGRITCHGCVALEYGNGYQCTAELTRTLYSVPGEVAPRAEDAAAPLSTIPGFRTRLESETVTSTGTGQQVSEAAEEPEATRHRRRLNWFDR
jgi:hypothetical protein